MKLVTFTHQGRTQAGILADDRVHAIAALVPGAPDDAITVITQWENLKGKLAAALKQAKGGHALSSVTLEAPIRRPGKILAIGLNYADHIAESGMETPKEQVWFTKLPTSVNAPFAPVQMPKASNALDYEAELVAVIGKRCKHVPKERAHEVVFGYACGNDVTARDWQFKTPQWVLGKSFDTHAPFGPAIVTSDELGDPHNLGIRCIVNGETRQSSNTKHLVFNIWDQIACISQAMTLEPGDIIFTGTPGGVGIAAKPPRLLNVGDVMRVEIDRLGAIEARIVAE
ncbi:MAG TPA: fumarylacetoacetate hydrolase family protein [Micropepsaceae bacterium]|nr:fumarylacetoacetate hydrolase family protein [Micropepsaceae bacterium]